MRTLTAAAVSTTSPTIASAKRVDSLMARPFRMSRWQQRRLEGSRLVNAPARSAETAHRISGKRGDNINGPAAPSDGTECTQYAQSQNVDLLHKLSFRLIREQYCIQNSPQNERVTGRPIPAADRGDCLSPSPTDRKSVV